MSMSKTGARIRLSIIDNYVCLAEKATSAGDRNYWLRQASAERNSLTRKIAIENFLDETFGPDEPVGTEK